MEGRIQKELLVESAASAYLNKAGLRPGLWFDGWGSWILYTLARLTAVLFAVYLFSIGPLSAVSREASEAASLQEMQLIIDTAKSGDIILRRGRGLASDLIVRNFSGSGGWSHCALVIAASRLEGLDLALLKNRIGFRNTESNFSDEELLVVHSVDYGLSGVDGVQIQSLRDFMLYSIPGSSAIFRPKFSKEGLEEIQRKALFAVCEGIPFDRSWSLSNQEALYCTEFLWYIIAGLPEAAQFSWEAPSGILAFTNFSNPAYFTRQSLSD